MGGKVHGNFGMPSLGLAGATEVARGSKGTRVSKVAHVGGALRGFPRVPVAPRQVYDFGPRQASCRIYDNILIGAPKRRLSRGGDRDQAATTLGFCWGAYS